MNESHSSSETSLPVPKPASGVVAPRVVLPQGPATVVNPERRPSADTSREQQPPLVPASSIVRSLFPVEDDHRPGDEFDASGGVSLGHFTIIERIRDGGMGAVFRALDARLNRVVALKVLPPALTRDSSSVQRFQNEAQAAAQLDHDNIARVYYIGEEQGLHFIAFEFVSGVNLRELIQQQDRLPVSDAVNYTLQIASALLHTSTKGVVHRDIKPSNIIITPSGRAKLVDLGLARKENKTDEEADLTLAGTTLGTFDYISPEQARDPRTADVRSDIYSLGCTLYHMLTGGPPFPQGTVLQKLLQHQGDDAPDPAQKNRKVPDNLSAIVRKMMAKDPRRRYQSAEQLVRDLMLVAGSMGLRSISSEGLIWMSAQTPRAGFLERHLAWMATVAALLLIVGYMQFGGIRFYPQAGDLSHSLRPVPRDGDRVANPVVIAKGAPRSATPSNGTRTPPGVVKQMGSSDPEPAATGSTPELKTPAVVAVVAGTERTTPDRTQATTSLPPDPLTEITTAVSLLQTAGGGVALGPRLGSDESALKPDQFSPPGASRIAPESVSLLPVDRSGTSLTPGSDGLDDSIPAGGDSPRSDATNPPAKSTASRGSDPATPLRTSDAISIIGPDGNPRQSFRTLEAACTAADNGSVIELRFNGKRTEGPARITKRLSIRAGQGYQPLIEFLPTQVPAEGYQTRMLTIAGGSLDLVGVDLLMSVRDAIPTDHWVLFAAQAPEALRLFGVTLTIRNPRRLPAEFFELQAGLVANVPDMEIGNSQPKPPQEIELSTCLVRGDGDLFVVRSRSPARLSVMESIVALDGTLLRSTSSAGGAGEMNPRIDIRLDHVTAVLTSGLLRLDSGDMPRRFPYIHMTAFNNILATNAREPMISMSGNAPTQDFRPYLSWNGRKNFYDGFETFWSISSTDATGKAESLDFSQWRNHWGTAIEGARAEPVGWKKNWRPHALADIAVADLALDRQAAGNPPVFGATNGSDAGANLPALAKLGIDPDAAVIDDQDRDETDAGSIE